LVPEPCRLPSERLSGTFKEPMYSVKPGRGPSTFGVIGAVIAAAFGVIWIVMAVSIGASGFFVFFGVVFVLLMIAGGIYNFYNATASNRVSEVDIVSSATEPDPLDRMLGRKPASPPDTGVENPDRFCPYCGSALSVEFKFCPACGKAIGPAI